MFKNFKCNRLYIICLTLFLAIFSACRKDGPIPKDELKPSGPTLTTIKSRLTDKNSTDETAALFYNLQQLAKTNILFGHQDDTKQGVNADGSQWGNWQQINPKPSRTKSDVHDVTGDYPAVLGSDFLHIANFNRSVWFQYETDISRQLAIDAYNRGQINTYCWHYINPVSKGGFYWSDSPVEAVSRILPGGDCNSVFNQSLKQIADFAKTLVGADGRLIPIIFRPFHEQDGDWFWWGKTHCTAQQYIDLYRYTVTYLRDELGVHNFLYCWSPGGNFNNLAGYLDRYPGDDYVDVLGTDNYDLNTGANLMLVSNKLKIISDYATSKNKIAAFSETGLANLTQIDWYTKNLLVALKLQKLQISYVLVWANTPSAFWTPQAGSPVVPDFIKFKNDNYVMLNSETPKMYRLPKI